MSHSQSSKIFSLGYKTWKKKFLGPAYRISVIAWTETINTLQTSKMVKVLLSIRIMGIVFGIAQLLSVGLFKVSYLISLSTFTGLMMSSSFLPLFVDGTTFIRVFTAILGSQFSFFDVLLIGFVGAKLISSDREYNTIVLYLSRPIRKYEYLIGKYGAALIYAMSFTWLPTTLYFFTLEALFKRTLAQLFADIFLLYIPALTSGLINCIVIITVVFALASLTKKGMYVGLLSASINPLSMMFSQVARYALQTDYWYLFSLPIMLKAIQLWFIDVPPALYFATSSFISETTLLAIIDVATCFIVIGVILAIAFYILIRQLRKLEVTE
ncbi:MAG: hypothetical protein ACTSYD_14600 [Candidatus Heimdallarchaeaceae archaeon]